MANPVNRIPSQPNEINRMINQINSQFSLQQSDITDHSASLVAIQSQIASILSRLTALENPTAQIET